MKRRVSPHRVLSDFIKGKIGGQASAAFLDLDGLSSADFAAATSPTITFQEIAGSHGMAVRSLRERSAFSSAATFGGLLTLPEVQANSIRLQALAHLAVLFGEGTKSPSGPVISRCFNAMEDGPCGEFEDPSESPLVDLTSSKIGDFRLLEGTAEANALQTSAVLDALTALPDVDQSDSIIASLRAILKLSDLVCHRSELPRYYVGLTNPRSEILSPTNEALHGIRKRVIFSDEELSLNGIEPALLEPFTLAADNYKSIASGTFGNSNLERQPVIRRRHNVALALPCAVGLAVRDRIIAYCQARGLSEAFQNELANAYAARLHQCRLLGSLPQVRPEFLRHGSNLFADLIIQVDAGRYVHFIFFCDGLDGYSQDGFMGTSHDADLSDLIERAISRAHASCARRAGFREGVTIIAGAGWGRALSVNLPRQGSVNWRIETIGIHDLMTLSDAPQMRAADFFRLLDARDRAEALGFKLMNANGLLNLYGFAQANDWHLVPHESLAQAPGKAGSGALILVTQNALLRTRVEAAHSRDRHHVPYIDRNSRLVERLNPEPAYGAEDLCPFYVAHGYGGHKHLQGVYETSNRYWWVEAETNDELESNTRWHLEKLVLHWGERIAAVLDRRLPHLPAGPRICKVKFLDRTTPGIADRPSISNTDQLFDVAVSSDGRTTNVTVGEGFLTECRHPANIAERSLVRAIVLAVIRGNERSFNEQTTAALVDEIVPDEGARHFHAFSAMDVRDHTRATLPPPRVINRLDDTSCRLGLGWLVRSPEEGELIEGRQKCCDYLNALTRAVSEQMMSELNKLDRSALVVAMLRNHEALAVEPDRWKKTYKSLRSLSMDQSKALERATRQIAQFNAASMASRIVCEMAICCCPEEGGNAPGSLEIGRLLANASLLFHFGGYSDAVHAGAMEAKIKIAPSGDVLMNHQFNEQIVDPLGQNFQAISLESSAEQYAEHYPNTTSESADPEEPIDGMDPRFKEAWASEFGFTLAEMGAFGTAFATLAETGSAAVLEMPRSQLLSRLVEICALPAEVVRQCVESFTLKPRSHWDEAPAGFQAQAWHPWRFRRQLSLISRPLVQIDSSEDPMMIVVPAMVTHHLSKFAADTHGGRLDVDFFRSASMRKWTGHITRTRGHKFNITVAERLKGLGWNALANLTIGSILARRNDPSLGDIDVLAWHADGRVLVVECKDLSMDKTFGEIARRLAKYRGELNVKGQPDDLRRHINRVDVLTGDVAAVARFVGMSNINLVPALVFDRPTPVSFNSNPALARFTITTLADLAAL